MSKAILYCGPSALGKTRACLTLAKKFPDYYIHVPFTTTLEDMARTASSIMAEHKVPLLDHTFLTTRERKTIIKLLPASIIECNFIFAPLETAIEYNEFHFPTPTPLDELRRQYEILEYPVAREGFSKINLIHADEDFNFIFKSNPEILERAKEIGVSASPDIMKAIELIVGENNAEDYLNSEDASIYIAIMVKNAMTLPLERDNPARMRFNRTYGGWTTLYCNYIREVVELARATEKETYPLYLNSTAITKGTK